MKGQREEKTEFFSRIREMRKKEEETQKEIVKPEITKPEEKTEGLSHRLGEIDEKLDIITQGTKVKKKLKKKKFKLPFWMKAKLKKLAKKNKVQVMLLQSNKNIKPTIGEIREGMLIIEDKIYYGSADIIWLWNGKVPTAIVPEWDLKPLTAEMLLEDAVKNKRVIHPQTIMIRAFEFKEAMQPKKLAGKTIIWLLIGGVVVFYVLFAQ